jgi:hypothetical protein
MPKPANQEDLLRLSQHNYQRLHDLVDTFSEAERDAEFPPGTMNRNIRDVLAHLHHWHRMMLDWYTVGMGGAKPDMPAKGYTWKTTPALNRAIWEMYRETSLQDVRQLLDASHAEVQRLIEAHDDEELFTKKRYKWTGTTSLGAYLVSATSSHYDWAYHLIKKARQ